MTGEEIEKIARLCRLTLTDDEKQRLAGDMTEILGYFEKLGEVDTSGVEVTLNVLGLTNAGRDDAPAQSFEPDTLKAMAPDFEAGQFIVPHVIASQSE